VRKRRHAAAGIADLRGLLSRRRLVAAGCVALLCGAGAFLGIRLAGSDPPVATGPLEPPASLHYWGLGHPVDVGERLSYGLLFLRNRSRRTATLEGVDAVEATPGMRIVGGYAQPIDDGPGVGLGAGFPPTPSGTIHAAVRGFAVRPGDEVRIVLGVVVDRTGRQQFLRLRLRYRVGSHGFASTWPLGLRLCAPASRYRGKCEPPTSDG
jgi:hypothetical protein